MLNELGSQGIHTDLWTWGQRWGANKDNRWHMEIVWVWGRRLVAKRRRVGVGRISDAHTRKYVYIITPLKIAAKDVKIQQRRHI